MITGVVPWRARIGLVIPQLDCITEPLLARLLPAGISFHVSRMKRTGPVNPDTLREMNRSVRAAVELLPLPYLDLVVYHCTTGSLLYDPVRLVADIEGQTGLPAVATAQAVVDALSHLGATRIGLVTPYVKALNDAEVAFLESRGFRVAAVAGVELEDSGLMQSLAPEEISLLARRVARQESQAVFVSCTGIRSLELLDELEADIGRPVVASTSAMLWQALGRLRLPQQLPGCGRLLRGGV